MSRTQIVDASNIAAASNQRTRRRVVSPRLAGTRFGGVHFTAPRTLRAVPRSRGPHETLAFGGVGARVVTATRLPRGGLCVPGGAPDDRGDGLLPERQVLGPARPDRGGQVDRHRLVADVLRQSGVLHARGGGRLRDAGRRVQARVLIAQLVLLGKQLRVLGPQLIQLVRGLGGLRPQHQVRDDEGEQDPRRCVGACERKEPKPFGGRAVGYRRDERPRRAPAARVSRPARAELAPGSQYSSVNQCFLFSAVVSREGGYGAWRRGAPSARAWRRESEVLCCPEPRRAAARVGGS